MYASWLQASSHFGTTDTCSVSVRSKWYPISTRGRPGVTRGSVRRDLVASASIQQQVKTMQQRRSRRWCHFEHNRQTCPSAVDQFSIIKPTYLHYTPFEFLVLTNSFLLLSTYLDFFITCHRYVYSSVRARRTCECTVGGVCCIADVVHSVSSTSIIWSAKCVKS